ncbi:hypothetical protein MTO96_010078 [Rhipicephalus appendiculatus]
MGDTPGALATRTGRPGEREDRRTGLDERARERRPSGVYRAVVAAVGKRAGSAQKTDVEVLVGRHGSSVAADAVEQGHLNDDPEARQPQRADAAAYRELPRELERRLAVLNAVKRKVHRGKDSAPQEPGEGGSATQEERAAGKAAFQATTEEDRRKPFARRERKSPGREEEETGSRTRCAAASGSDALAQEAGKPDKLGPCGGHCSANNLAVSVPLLRYRAHAGGGDDEERAEPNKERPYTGAITQRARAQEAEARNHAVPRLRFATSRLRAPVSFLL